MSVACSFGPAERQMHFRTDRWRIDVRDAGIDIAHGLEGLVYIARINRRRESVLNSIGNLNGVLEVIAENERGDRAEDLLLGNAHFWIYASEYRGLKAPPAVIRRTLHPLPPQFHL